MVLQASQMIKLLVSLDISQHNVLVIFALKRSTILRSVKNYIMLFEERDRSSPINNFTDSLNLRELQVDDISKKYISFW